MWVVLAPHQSRNAFEEAPARIMNIAAEWRSTWMPTFSTLATLSAGSQTSRRKVRVPERAALLSQRLPIRSTLLEERRYG